MSTLNVNFYCRRSKANSKGLSPIEMTIIIDGQRCNITLPRKEEPSLFQKLVSQKKDSELKQYLSSIRSKVNHIVTDMTLHDIPLTADSIKKYYGDGGVKLYSIEQLFQDYFSILEKRVGINLTAKTFRKYVLARDKFYTVIRKDKPVQSITNAVVMNYIATLNKQFDPVTSVGYIQKIKTVVMFGIANSRIATNPFFDVHIDKPAKDIKFLTEQEIEKIKSKEIDNQSLAKVRDVFIFQVNSGLSFCDMASLTREDYKQNGEGQYYIHKRRMKTSVYFTSVIFPDGVEILQRYDFVLPIISNQKYNLYLKDIKNLCDIHKPIHSHIARHTYATMCLNHGIRLEVVAKLLGHSSTKITTHYAKLIESTILSEVEEAFNSAK